MKLIYNFLGISLLLAIGLYTSNSYSQLGFCSGNSGDPIFTETFGAGTLNGPALGSSTTSYTYADGTPIDGSYTISNYTGYYGWHVTPDHTPNDSSGKSLIVNADYTPGEFYKRTVTGLCENTSYEFSSWLLNLLPSSDCQGNGIPINVKFQIWDATDTDLLASGDTGDIANKTSPVWEQYGLVFQTISGQTSVILKMLNNGPGGCGNDLAIDDIVFKTCGDFIEINDSQNKNNIEACEENGPVAATLNATPDFSIYTSHAYQWQESVNGTNWVNITGETNQSYTTPALTSSTYYRVKVAEDAINLTNELCSSVSEIFDILIIAQPANPTSNGNIDACINEPKLISVSVPQNIEVNWYDAATGGNLIQEKSASYVPAAPGTYYAEALSELGHCPSNGRTAVSIQFIALPVVNDENLTFCENTSIELSAKVKNATYLWNTGATTETITASEEGTYTVAVTNSTNCTQIKTITLSQINAPEIKSIKSSDYDIIISLTNEIGVFEYSIDGFNYQDSPIFLYKEGGLYTVVIREKSGCGILLQEFIHFVIPKFFSPNGDGINDEFVVGGIDQYTTYDIKIFDRYGQLLKSLSNSTINWNGSFNNEKLPSDDYWYVISTDNNIFKGHFALKR